MSDTKTPRKTLVTLLLDRSGSMQAVKDDTIGAINAYFQTLRASGEDIRVSLVQFDSQGSGLDLKRVFVAVPAAEVRDLTGDDFHPRGMTPLIDAACTTIRAVAESLQGPKGDGVQVVFAIQTDGQENASTENGWDDLRSLIAERELAGWQFVFMGCGIDAYDQGARMGISADRTLSYGQDAEETRAAFAATAENVREMASGARASMEYSPAQRRASGERRRP